MKSIAFLGDSLTDALYSGVYGTSGADCHPHVCQTILRAAGFDVQSRNFGIAVDTTTQMLARISQTYFYDTPTLGVMYGGANDGGASATTTDNIVAACKAMVAAGAKGILVIGSHYKNWATGGDTTTTQETGYAAIRVAQQAAVTALIVDSAVGGKGIPVVYVDTYAAMRALILASTETQGSNCWSALPNNQHLNCKRTRGSGLDGGHDVIGKAVAAAIQANPAMVLALA